MKNRKSVIVAFLLVATLLLGVGYAALTDELTINGTAKVDATKAEEVWEAKVYFSASEVTSSTGSGTTADTVSHTADAATFAVNKLALKDEKVVFTYTIKNDSDVDAVISVKSTSETDTLEKFTVAYAYPNGMTIAAGQSITVTVTVTLDENIVDTTEASFSLVLTATAQEPTA